ncbi:hypothetical protein [Micromonospora coxensis]|uniref:Uncharacterized protein n=1 Tax=Micromonospora coxensis TaxID=356852 RepID=A0A1C5GKI6_9ACTN|nr:hypothetical protein [Micromonospora coxensis]SCG34269.1 hypothetical protein GA0070614_0022 [Micromonospora coxensis]
MSRDDEVLHSLDHYETALLRVSADFRSRGAAVEPTGVRLDTLDAILVAYRVAGGGGPHAAAGGGGPHAVAGGGGAHAVAGGGGPHAVAGGGGPHAVAGGGRSGAVGALPMVRTVEEAVVALADILQEKALEEGDTAWPGCRPGHPHPPTPRLSGGTAVWSCPRDAGTLSGIG